jgi:aminoglycoside phosphotransferase (APT) family kinase protein
VRDWLEAHLPPDAGEPSVVHGDFKLDNVLLDPSAGRVAAVVDWEMATVGDPLLDLGWVMMGWPDPGAASSNGYVDYTGMPSRAEMLDYYTNESGRPVDDIDYYVILARFKIAIVLEGGYARLVKGDADNPKMQAFGDIVLSMMRDAAELAGSTTL